MPRGRKPDPPALKVIKANAGRNPPPFASIREAGAPEKPDTIAVDPVASAEWDRLVGLLSDRSILSPADLGIMVDYCSAYSRVVACRLELVGKPLTITNKVTGAVKAHPLLGVLSGAERSLYTFASALGLTPTDRGRVTTIEDVGGSKSPIDRLRDRAEEARSRFVRPDAVQG